MVPRIEITLLLAAVCIAVAGFVIDARYGHDAFPRAGSLITALGVAMAGREVWRAEMAIARNEARVEKLEAAYLDAVSTKGRIDAEAFSRLAEMLGNYRTSRLQRVGRLVFAEIATVCAGTLIWGFGDLVV